MGFDVTALSAYIEDQDFPLIAQLQATGGLAESGVNIQTAPAQNLLRLWLV